MRRSNGSGTVIKLSGKRRKPYAARITVGSHKNEKGEYIQSFKYIGYFEKQSEALSALEKYNVGGELPPTPCGMRFSEIYALWDAEKPAVSVSAQKTRFMSYKYLKPLHEMVFSKIRLTDLEEAIKPHLKKSDSTISHIKSLLKGMYRYALRHDIVDKDYSALLEVAPQNAQKRPHTPFTDSEVETLWQNKNDRTARIMLVLIYTGMRVMEYLSMPTSAFHGDYLIGGEKTAAGRDRVIPLHRDIIPLIQPDGDRLVTNGGKPYTYDTYKEQTEKLFARLGMNHTPHDARHTCASKMEEAGIDPYHRKLILGHAISDITFGVYTHVTPEVLVEDINRIRFDNG